MLLSLYEVCSIQGLSEELAAEKSLSLPSSEHFLRGLFYWHRSNYRDFPWRRTTDPYAILLAEILLAKTNAEKVLAVYEKVLSKYGTPAQLSRCSIPELREEIRGLGLWRKRPKALKALAKALCDNYDSKVPLTRKNLLELPSVGEYTASALLCQVANQHEAMVDVNVRRVLGRFFCGKDLSLKEAAELAKATMPFENARNFNLALLDFGALVCTARLPKCSECPLASQCEFFTHSRLGATSAMQ